MTFLEACELLTEILVGKKTKKKNRKTGRRAETKTRRRYTRRKSK